MSRFGRDHIREEEKVEEDSAKVVAETLDQREPTPPIMDASGKLTLA